MYKSINEDVIKYANDKGSVRLVWDNKRSVQSGFEPYIFICPSLLPRNLAICWRRITQNSFIIERLKAHEDTTGVGMARKEFYYRLCLDVIVREAQTTVDRNHIALFTSDETLLNILLEKGWEIRISKGHEIGKFRGDYRLNKTMKEGK